jgi:hypothetical protein
LSFNLPSSPAEEKEKLYLTDDASCCVSFAHASARNDVLALATEKKLLLLPASEGIYINPDLFPAEVKAAYEARQARKTGTSANLTSDVVTPFGKTNKWDNFYHTF